jgi:histidine ammonia-lyase
MNKLQAPMELQPGQITLASLEEIYRTSQPARLGAAAREDVERAARIIAEAVRGEAAVYGVNTGFGKLSSVRIPAEDTATLQRNLILSHCCGVGAPISRAVTRLMMTLKLLSLGRGASGVRWQLIELLQAMLERDVLPVIPAQGSVGASGDLAPLAHMTAPMLGEGYALFEGEILPGGVALEKAGLRPIELGPKEGLAMINGTQFSTALALAGLFEAWRLAQTALLSDRAAASRHSQPARPSGADRGRGHGRGASGGVQDPCQPP